MLFRVAEQIGGTTKCTHGVCVPVLGCYMHLKQNGAWRVVVLTRRVTAIGRWGAAREKQLLNLPPKDALNRYFKMFAVFAVCYRNNQQYRPGFELFGLLPRIATAMNASSTNDINHSQAGS